MSEAERKEFEVLEYARGLEGLGLGQKAWALYLRAATRDVRPLLLRQKTALRIDADDVVTRLDADIAAAWGRCLESLKTLWLTEGPQSNEDDAA
jgi:hypothetical protein